MSQFQTLIIISKRSFNLIQFIELSLSLSISENLGKRHVFLSLLGTHSINLPLSEIFHALFVVLFIDLLAIGKLVD